MDRLLYAGARAVSGGNLVDCSMAVAAQTGDSAVVSNTTTEDSTTTSSQQQSKTPGKVTVRVNLMMAWICSVLMS